MQIKYVYIELYVYYMSKSLFFYHIILACAHKDEIIRLHQSFRTNSNYVFVKNIINLNFTFFCYAQKYFYT